MHLIGVSLKDNGAQLNNTGMIAPLKMLKGAWDRSEANHLKVASSQIVAARCPQLPGLSKARGFQVPASLVATRTF